MNYLVDERFSCFSHYLGYLGRKSHYPLHPSIKWYKLDLGSPFRSASWLQRLKRQLSMRRIASNIAPTHVGFQFGTFLAIRTHFLDFHKIYCSRKKFSPVILFYKISAVKSIPMVYFFALCRCYYDSIFCIY